MRQRKGGQSQYLLARQIVAFVRDQRLDREHHLVETGLAERFGVSRTLIRAALKRLAREKIVEPRRNQGFFLLKAWDNLEGKVIDVPPTVEEQLYRTLVRDRMSGKIPERITQVALGDRYSVDRSALLRVLARMADEGIVVKNKGHGWTFLPTINTEVSLRNSYDLRRTLEPNGMLLESFRVDIAALDRLRALHASVLTKAATVSASRLFELDTEFHEIVASFTHNSFFVQAIQQQNRLRRLLEYRGYENRRRVRSWVREHIAIIDALKVGKLGLASQLMSRHLEEAYSIATLLRRSNGQSRANKRK